MFWETFEKLDLDAGDATWLHNTSSNLEKQKKCTDKYEYIYLPKDPFKKHPNKKGECYLIRRGEV